MNLRFFYPGRRLSVLAGALPSLQTDVHAHILPGLQDGVESPEQSIRLLRQLAGMGLRKVVGTLHIMSDFYTNTAETILEASRLLQHQLHLNRIPIQLIPAAQYYIDRGLMRLLYTQSDLLTFGDRDGQQYLLFGTNLVLPPPELENVLAAFRRRGIRPIMTHAERYSYLQKNPEYAFILQEMGVLFQISLPTLAGNPAQASRQLAEWLIDRELVSFLGSNLNRDCQLPQLQYAMTLPSYHKALQLGVRNELI